MLTNKKNNNYLELVLKKIDGNDRNQLITFINPYTYLCGRKNIELYDKIDKIYIDGIFIVKLLRLLGLKKTSRQSFDFTSLAPIVFDGCVENQKSIYFVGSTENSITDFVKQLKIKYPNLNILGYRNGYFNNELEKKHYFEEICNLNPDVVVVGMGAILQEQFIVDLKENNWSGIAYTCGGFFHQTAKNINYYPEIFDKLNIRWIYRIYDEPYLLKRYLIDYFRFMLVFVKDFISYSRS